MSAFDGSLCVFPVSAVLLSGLLASIVGSDGNSASAQESQVTGSSFSSTTSVHDDKHVRNAVLQHSASEARPQGEMQRGWTAAHGKAPSRSRNVVSLQSTEARPGTPIAQSRKFKPATSSGPRTMFVVSAGRPAIPPVPEPVRDNALPEDPEAIELAPVEPLPASAQSDVESSSPEQPVQEPSASETIPSRQPSAGTLSTIEEAPGSSQGNIEQQVLSASQRLKLALEEERRRVLAEQADASEETPELPSLDGDPIDLAPVDDMLVLDLPTEQSPSPFELPESSEIPADDPETRLLDERARRFIRLKKQLMQLKSQLEQPDPTDLSEPSPSLNDQAESDPSQNGVALDSEPGHDGPSEGLLPPVEGSDALDSGRSETGEQSPEHGGNDVSPQETSAQDDSSEVATQDATTPHGPGAVDNEHFAESQSNTHAGEPASSEPEADGNAALAASEHAVVHGTIDRLGLANNLYAVGEYELALDMYEKIDMTELTAQQQVWAEYQMANCLRRMGRNGEASNRYRRIAEQPEAGWLSEQSRWWVDVLEQIRQLQSSLEENTENIEETLQSPFQGIPRDSKSLESTKSGSMKSSGAGQLPGAKSKSDHNVSAASSSARTSSRTTKPSKERITHFAPSEMEP